MEGIVNMTALTPLNCVASGHLTISKKNKNATYGIYIAGKREMYTICEDCYKFFGKLHQLHLED